MVSKGLKSLATKSIGQRCHKPASHQHVAATPQSNECGCCQQPHCPTQKVNHATNLCFCHTLRPLKDDLCTGWTHPSNIAGYVPCNPSTCLRSVRSPQVVGSCQASGRFPHVLNISKNASYFLSPPLSMVQAKCSANSLLLESRKKREAKGLQSQ